tara:strand:+ start:584 stop:904 length:321 start_codon:yes stop_codon:yes gene_type:complete
MDPVVILITLIATFSSYDNVNFYSHNPNVMFVSDDMCNDVLNEAADYFHNGAREYVENEFPNETLYSLSLECMRYTIDIETGEFEPLEYDYQGDWDSVRPSIGTDI